MNNQYAKENQVDKNMWKNNNSSQMLKTYCMYNDSAQF